MKLHLTTLKTLAVSAVLATSLIRDASAVTIFQDDFNRPDGTPIGPGWTMLNNTTWNIAGNKLDVVWTGANSLLEYTGYTLGSTAPDFSASLDVKTPYANTWAGQAFNIQDAANFYAFRFIVYNGVNAGKGGYQLLKFAAGSPTVVPGGNGTIFGGMYETNWYRITVTVSSAGNIAFTLANAATPGTPLLSSSVVDATPYSGGLAGIYSGDTTAADNYVLSASAGPVTATATWTGTIDGDWGTAANWGGTLPTFDNTLDVTIAGTNNVGSMVLGADRTIRSLTFAASLSNSNSLGLPFAWLTFDSASGTPSITIDSGTPLSLIHDDIGGGRIILNKNLTITHNGGNPFVITRWIDGVGSLTKEGPGTLVLRDSHTFNGPLNLNAGTLGLYGILPGTYSTLGWNHLQIAGGTTLMQFRNIPVTYAGLVVVNGDFTISGFDDAMTLGTAVHLGTVARQITVSANVAISGVISGAGGGLIKAGASKLTLSGTNTYTGDTTINAGTLLVNGSIAAGAVTVANAGTLGGNGTVDGPVTVASGGTLSLGDNAIGTLSVNNSLVLAAGSTTVMEVNNATKDAVGGLTAVTFGGTLTVSNLGGTFVSGDTYQLFSAASYTGNFAATHLPALDPGLAWNWNPANGTLAVAIASYATTATNISYSLSGGNLTLTWPGSHLGWLAQSNSVNLVDTNYWFDIAGSQAATNLNITINPALPQVFYRLRLP